MKTRPVRDDERFYALLARELERRYQMALMYSTMTRGLKARINRDRRRREFDLMVLAAAYLAKYESLPP